MEEQEERIAKGRRRLWRGVHTFNILTVVMVS